MAIGTGQILGSSDDDDEQDFNQRDINLQQNLKLHVKAQESIESRQNPLLHDKGQLKQRLQDLEYQEVSFNGQQVEQIQRVGLLGTHRLMKTEFDNLQQMINMHGDQTIASQATMQSRYQRGQDSRLQSRVIVEPESEASCSQVNYQQNNQSKIQELLRQRTQLNKLAAQANARRRRSVAVTKNRQFMHLKTVGVAGQIKKNGGHTLHSIKFADNDELNQGDQSPHNKQIHGYLPSNTLQAPNKASKRKGARSNMQLFSLNTLELKNQGIKDVESSAFTQSQAMNLQDVVDSASSQFTVAKSNKYPKDDDNSEAGGGGSRGQFHQNNSKIMVRLSNNPLGQPLKPGRLSSEVRPVKSGVIQSGIYIGRDGMVNRYKGWVAQEKSYISKISGGKEIVVEDPIVEDKLNAEQIWLSQQYQERKSKTIMLKEAVEQNYRKLVTTAINNVSRRVRISKECLALRGRVQRRMLAVMKSKVFKWFMLTCIIVNSVALAFYSYNTTDMVSPDNKIIDWINYSLQFVYIFEMVVRMVARDLFTGRKAYFRSGWHYIDIIIVLSGFIELSNFSNIPHNLRALRILRPLKVINYVKSLKNLIESLIFAMPEFANVGIFVIFVFLLFSTMGLHLYNGFQYNACRTTVKPVGDVWPWDSSIARVCTITGFGRYECPAYDTCGNPAFQEIYDISYEQIETKAYAQFGIINFDHVGTSLLTVFQMITSETWQFQMYNIMDSDVPLLAALYSFLVIIVGQFFLLNLILAVIIQAFVNIQKVDLKDKMDKLEKKQSKRNKQQAQHNEEEEKSEEESQRDDSNSLRQILSKRVTHANNEHDQKQHKSILFHDQDDQKSLNEIYCGQEVSFEAQKEKNHKKSTRLRKIHSAIAEENHDDRKTDSEDRYKHKNNYKVNNNEDSIQFFLRPAVKKRKVMGLLMNSPSPIKDGDELQQSPDFPLQNEGQQTFQESSQQVSNFEQLHEQQNEMKETLPHGFNLRLLQTQQDGESPAPQDDIDLSKQKVLTQLEYFMKNKVDEKLQKHIQDVIKNAKENFDKFKNDPSMKAQSLKQLVGLKICLNIIQKMETSKISDDLKYQLDTRLKKNFCYKFAFKIMVSPLFKWIMLSIIIGDIIILSRDSYPIVIRELQLNEYLNCVFIALYIIEQVIRITSIGFRYYFKGSQFNTLDTAIIGFGLIDIFVSATKFWNSEFLINSIGITIIRSVRLLRIFKLARYWMRFELLLETMTKTIVEIRTFSIMMAIFIYFYTIMGLEFFANQAKFNSSGNVDLLNGTSPMFHFDNFLNSLFTVFIVVTNDGQSSIYYNFYRAVSGSLATAFWITLVILGQKVLLNLFLAFLLENFDEGALKEKIIQLQILEEQNEHILNDKGDFNKSFAKSQDKLMKDFGCLKFIQEKWKSLILWIRCLDPFERELLIIKSKKFKNQLSLSQSHKKLSNPPKTALSMTANKVKKLKEYNPDIPFLYGKSLGLLSATNPIRIFAFNLITSKKFEYFIIASIIVSSIQLALDGPLVDPNSQYQKTLDTIDLVTTIIFICEAIAKITAVGFIVNGPWSYLRKAYNQLDFVIIVLSIISLTSVSQQLNAIKMLRIFRALRLISKNDGLKVALSSLFQAIPNVANVTIIMLLFFLIFGVISTSYFKGKQFTCQGKYHGDVETKWDCLDFGGEWVNRVFTFDSIPNSLVTLFVMSTTAGWSEQVVLTLAAGELDHVPTNQRDPAWIIFYMVFMIVVCFFFLNLFVGVVVSNFNSEADKIGGNNLLTKKQKEWIDLKLLVLRSQPIQILSPPKTKFRGFFFKIHEKAWFHNFVLLCIVLNTIVLMLKWYRQSSSVYQITEMLNYIFTCIFIIEVIIKNLAIGPRLYFSDGWNTYDFVIVLGSFAGIFISSQTNIQIKGATSVFRAFRIMRIMRLIKRGSNSLNLIFNTFVITLHSLVNIGGLLLMFIYMYSILGMIIFGNMKRNGIMNDYNNFETFTNAFTTLFVVATGDSWNYTTAAFTMENSPINGCINGAGFDEYIKYGNQTMACGNKIQAYCFFVSYMFVVNLVFLKLFIAIILQGYSSTQTQDKRLFNIDMNERFREVWAEFDPEATTFINMSQLRHFLFALGGPLGFDQRYLGQRFLQDQFIANLDLPTYTDFTSYQFMDILDALSFRMMVLDHIKKNNNWIDGALNQIGNTKQKNDENVLQATASIEGMIKDQMQKEINCLIFQKKSENIAAVKEVYEKEVKKIKNKEKTKDKAGFTSSHHMAAEAIVRQFRVFLMISRKLRLKFDNLKDKVRDNYANHRTIGNFNYMMESNLQMQDSGTSFFGPGKLLQQNTLSRPQGPSMVGLFGSPSGNKMQSNLPGSAVYMQKGTSYSNQLPAGDIDSPTQSKAQNTFTRGTGTMNNKRDTQNWQQESQSPRNTKPLRGTYGYGLATNQGTLDAQQHLTPSQNPRGTKGVSGLAKMYGKQIWETKQNFEEDSDFSNNRDPGLMMARSSTIQSKVFVKKSTFGGQINVRESAQHSDFTKSGKIIKYPGYRDGDIQMVPGANQLQYKHQYTREDQIREEDNEGDEGDQRSEALQQNDSEDDHYDSGGLVRMQPEQAEACKTDSQRYPESTNLQLKSSIVDNIPIGRDKNRQHQHQQEKPQNNKALMQQSANNNVPISSEKEMQDLRVEDDDDDSYDNQQEQERDSSETDSERYRNECHQQIVEEESNQGESNGQD